MNKSSLRRRIAVLALVMAGATIPIAAQVSAKAFTPPRLKDGKPNLQGLWRLYSRPGVAPTADGGPGDIFAGMEYLPEAAAKKKENLTKLRDDLVFQCVTASVPGATLYPPFPFQILQDGKYFLIVYEYAHDVRIIPADGSPHPANFAALNGDSRGHWDGDTLVVDVTNFDTIIRRQNMLGDFLDENEHAVERYTLIDPDTIRYEATIEDPTVLTKPWHVRTTLVRQPKNDRLLENACREGERDLPHYFQDDRPSEGSPR